MYRKMAEINYIDLFAGTSALSEGFKQNGMNPVTHVEVDRDACLTIKTRVAFHFLREENRLDIYYDYITGKRSKEEIFDLIPDEYANSVINAEISDDSLEDIFSTIENRLKSFVNKDIDLIVGGPPCQAYSLRNRYGIDWENDPRLNLYIQYGKFLKKFRPKGFVFENVPGFLSANEGCYYRSLEEYFNDIGYEVSYEILNAKDYGVLQNRRRVVIVGWKKELKLSYPDITPIEHEFTTKEIFGDLASLAAGGSKRVGKYERASNEYLTKFAIRNGFDSYTQHVTRPHNPNDLKIYKLAIRKWEEEFARLKYDEIPEELRTQKNTTSFLDRYKVVNGQGLSHTVIAHISKDGHHYIHPDITQCRSISVREAARIQSFPDDFYFEGSRTAALRQIGNAVPPLLSDAIAVGIKKRLCES